MKKVLPALMLAVSALCLSTTPLPAPEEAGEPYVPTDAERARWTMADMRTLAIALSAFHTDNGRYPDGETLQAAIPDIEPSYVRKAPSRDAWGTPFKYVPDPGGSGYLLVSAGADLAFDASTWSTETKAASFGEDAVVRTGDFTRVWVYR